MTKLKVNDDAFIIDEYRITIISISISKVTISNEETELIGFTNKHYLTKN